MQWYNELENNLIQASDLTEYMHLSETDMNKMDEILKRYPMSITKYYASLIDWNDEGDPIRKMAIPTLSEFDLGGSFDTSGEADNTKIVGMQHKYPQTALILSTSQCAMYCRHCFRKRLVGLSDEEIADHFDEMIDYIRDHKEISNILVSGGDAFLNLTDKIEQYLEALTKIPHLDLIRFGTRTPVVYPQRILDDPELISVLRTYNKKKQIYVVTQFNHPKEITEESMNSVKALLDIGVGVRNQTVLLKGINDNPFVLGTLLKKLTAIGVIPYYVFQCRPVTGVKNQFQVPLEDGLKIVEAAKNMQNGLGKSFRYCLSHYTGKIEIVGKLPDGKMLFKYNQAKDEINRGRIFTLQLEKGQKWLGDIPQ